MQPVITSPTIRNWLYDLADDPADPLLAEMHRLAAKQNFPIVGPEVGRLLQQIVMLTGAKRVFEMGSGFGYSTLWFARALGEGGHVTHTDGDQQNSQLAKSFLERAGVADRVTFLVGDARDLLRQTDGEFDIIFCDIDKHQYPAAYEQFADRVRPGGAVIIDNLIWSGQVADGMDDPDTEGVRQYIDRMWNDGRFASSLLPIRDGVGLSLRK